MKKLFTLLFLGSFILMGCNKNAVSNENKGQIPESEMSYGEILLADLKEVYKSRDFPYTVVYEVVHEFETNKQVTDKKIKKELINILNDSVLKMLKTKNFEEWVQLKEVFYPDEYFEGITDFENITGKEYLKDDVKEKIIGTISPTYVYLKNQNLQMETLPDYKDEITRLSTWDLSTLQWLDENKVNYKFLGEDYASSSFIVLTDENIIIELKINNVVDIFKIKDKDGNPIEPFNVLKCILQ